MQVTNKHNVSDIIKRAVEKEAESRFRNKVRSVTQLIQPPQQYQLQNRYWDKIVADVMDQFFALFGTSIHYVLGNVALRPGELVEKRFSYHSDLGEYVITGQIDHYLKKVLTDFKVTSAWSISYGLKYEWEQQVNMYVALLELYDYIVDQAQVCVLLRDWSRLQAIRSKQFPQQPILTIPIPIWPGHKTMDMINALLTKHIEAETKVNFELPECTETERWAKPDVWAVYKVMPGTKGSMEKLADRAAKLCVTADEANTVAVAKMNKTQIKHIVKFRKGESVRCERYCNVAPYCNQWANLKQGK